MNEPLALAGRAWSRLAAATVVIVSACAFALTAAAPADTVPPLLSLGPVTIANGTATLSGQIGGTPDASTTLTVNGQPLGLDAAGNFTGTVNLGGQSTVDLAITNPLTGEVATISIPLTTNLGPTGTIPATVLDLLRQAGITLTLPPDGFKVLDGLPLEVAGKVLDKDVLSSLTLNGIDILGLLKPDGTFTQTIPGSSKEVTLSATDKQGVSQSSAFPVSHISSTIGTQSGISVSAAGAKGLKIAKVRYVLKGVKARKRVRMIVTVRDTRGYLVRDAKVRVRPSSFNRKRLVGGQQARLTGKLGQAGFTLRLRAKQFKRPKRLFMVSTALTPSAKAQKTTSVRIPKLKRQALRR
jgi:hypothetical protein